MNRTEAPEQREDPVTAEPARDHATAADVLAAFQLAAGAAFENLRGRRIRSAWIAAGAVTIVNYVAFRAQLRFWQAHLDPADAVLVAVALESIAIFWAWLAHQALVADDSALRPRLAAYGIALVIGALNYSHYCDPGWRPTVAAVTFGMMSVISPWLWSGYSRRVSRPVLKARNLIEDHAVRLGITRWCWHVYRCVKVMHAATWTGENRPAEAIKLISKPGTPEPEAGTADRQSRRQDPDREPRPAAARRAAREGDLTAARSKVESDMIRKLIQSGEPLPNGRQLARDPELAHLGAEATRRRAAGRILDGARAGLNGANGHERDSA